MAGKPHLHVNPTQLNAPEKLLWGLTGRQLFILALGGSVGYRLWSHFAFLLTFGLAGFGARLLVSVIPVLLSLALATIQLGGRFLETWAVLLLRYSCKQKQAVWCSVQVKDRYALASAPLQQSMGNNTAAGEEGE